MESIFTKIIQKEIPGYIIAEDSNNIALLDIRPIIEGHTLCVPKNQVDKLYELPESDYISLQLFTQKIATALEKAVPCQRIGFTVIGLEVPHAHIHLIPINKESDLSFAHPRLNFTPEEYENLIQKIRAHIA